jgi:tRNA(His) 5'-end guanylyltransferase
MKDSIGDRMKNDYENITRYSLPRKTYTVIRIDGKAFHTLTKKLMFKKPFDKDFIQMMDETAKYLCENIQGAIVGYVQSDEISIILQDFKDIHTCAWFDANIQKIASVSASMATAKFNSLMNEYIEKEKKSCKELEDNGVTRDVTMKTMIKLSTVPFALFDSRCFTISKCFEAYNYLVWRNKDCIRNSILSVAQTKLGRKEVENKNCKILKEILFEQGYNWNEYADEFKYGRLIRKIQKSGENSRGEKYIRNVWVIQPAFDLVENDTMKVGLLTELEI